MAARRALLKATALTTFLAGLVLLPSAAIGAGTEPTAGNRSPGSSAPATVSPALAR